MIEAGCTSGKRKEGTARLWCAFARSRVAKETLFLTRPALTTSREPHLSPLTSRPLSSPPRGVSVQFSLSEVTEIRVLNPLDPESGGRMFSFMVIQAPLSVVLRCKDTNERKWWLAQLEKRVELWRERRREEMAMMGYAHASLATAPPTLRRAMCCHTRSQRSS